MTPSPFPAAESAVRASDGQPAETERERAGAERPEEGDGGDEGGSVDFFFFLILSAMCVKFS